MKEEFCCIVCGKEKRTFNVSIITEKMGKKMVYLARCEELGISDFGENVQEALKNLKSGLNLLLRNNPEKAKLKYFGKELI